MLRRFSAALVASSLLFASAPALAQMPRDRDRELETLEKNLTDENAALSTSDCATACRALASIRRAADKICALDPGERCAAGRAKADDATRRVREACPECAVATAPPAPAPRPDREERAMSKGGADAAPTNVASAPPSESKRGGCAGCVTAPTSATDLTTAALAGIALAAALALRRRKRPTPSR